VTNFDRKVTRGSSFTDNTFRNILELRYNTPNDRTWLINELPIEHYLRGLAETSDSSHEEFKKTLLVAARTYAYYHWQRATKHDEEGFHVDAYADQVYNGYGYEARTPNITKAVEATRGITVTYDGETAITAYFSRSDGRTRDWSEVWGGSVPWSKSVAVPCDVGKTLWGHGVGMSASGGLCMAKEGKTYDEILKYFYTGVDLEKRWE
jgi:stage II sporulation protein D